MENIWKNSPVLKDQIFGRWTVVEQGEMKNKRRTVRCVCTCGVIKDVFPKNLLKGKSKSCGCLSAELASVRKKKHGQYKSLTWGKWNSMINRAVNYSSSNSFYYEERGITVSEDWQGENGFSNFLRDMGECPVGLTLDRIDNDRNYEKGNCQWATRNHQSTNKRPWRKGHSGRIGVHYDSSVNKWRASLVCKGVRHNSPKYSLLEDAVQAIEEMEIKFLGYNRS